jgi:hypothetical protein
MEHGHGMGWDGMGWEMAAGGTASMRASSELPSLASTSTSALALSSARTVSSCPLFAATISGVIFTRGALCITSRLSNSGSRPFFECVSM